MVEAGRNCLKNRVWDIEIALVPGAGRMEGRALPVSAQLRPGKPTLVASEISGVAGPWFRGP